VLGDGGFRGSETAGAQAPVVGLKLIWNIKKSKFYTRKIRNFIPIFL